MFMDLIIGGYVNLDNRYLLSVPANWGPGGYLNFSDQFSVLIGYFFFLTALSVPFVVLKLSEMKWRAPFMNKVDEYEFDLKYDFLYKEFRTSN